MDSGHPYNQNLLNQLQQTIGTTNNAQNTNLAPLLKAVSDRYDSLEKQLVIAESLAKLRTQQLIASTSQSYSFLDSLSFGFIMFDVTGEVVITNNSAKKMLKVKHVAGLNSIAEWSLALLEKVFAPEISMSRIVTASIKEGKTQEFPSLNYSQQVFHVYLAPMTSQVSATEIQQIGAILLLEDITEQKALERSKDDFLSIASHELRTPLTAIRGNTSLIQKYYKDKLPDKDVVEMVDDIHSSAIRLIGIVNDFLDASSLEQGKMKMQLESFNITDVIDECVREMQTLANQKGIKLEADDSTRNQPLIRADRQRIKQVIYNLTGNSVKFTEKGGVYISIRISQGFMFVYFRDTGPGISKDVQHLLFRKFQQAGHDKLTRDTAKGTGLGLYISKLIVHQLKGNIGLVNSEIGKGTIFYFCLPLNH
jgi:signal transduction histidine kinase